MNKKVFCTDKIPQPNGPYSQAVIYNETLYISGQLPLDPLTGDLVQGGIEEQAPASLNRLKIIAEEAGFSLKGALKVTCYLTDMNDFKRFNEIYALYFNDAPPARTAFQVGKLPLGAKIEIDAIIGRTEQE
jgi:2-iminobutanoate/2-iminopropanoate deaminase